MRVTVIPAIPIVAVVVAILTGCAPAQDQACPVDAEALAEIVGAPVAETVVSDSTEYPEYAPYGTGEVAQVECEVRLEVPSDGQRFHVHRVVLRSVDAAQGAGIADDFFAITGNGLSAVDSWAVDPSAPAGWGERAWLGVTAAGEGRAEFEAEGRFWSLYVTPWDAEPGAGAADPSALVALVQPVTESVGAAVVKPY